MQVDSFNWLALILNGPNFPDFENFKKCIIIRFFTTGSQQVAKK
jgi:hypothetical protein